MKCSFCGTETPELALSRGFAICHVCIQPKNTVVEVGQIEHCSFCANAIGTKKTIKRCVAEIRKIVNLPRCAGNVCKPLPLHLKLLKTGVIAVLTIFRLKTIRAARTGQGVILCNQCLPTAKKILKKRRKQALKTSLLTQ